MSENGEAESGTASRGLSLFLRSDARFWACGVQGAESGLGREEGGLFARGGDHPDRQRDSKSFRRGDFTRWAELAGLSGARAR